MHRLGEFLGRKGGNPRSILAAPGADFGDDDEIVLIRMERFPNQLIGDVRAVEVAGVDVVDAGGEGFAQDGDGLVARRAD